MKQYGAIVVDPPWEMKITPSLTNHRHKRPDDLPYSLMTLDDLAALPIATLATNNAHIWLWTTNQYLRQSFDLLGAWGARYHTTMTWVKPSGCGSFFVTTTQHLLFGYYGKLKLKTKYQPTGHEWVPRGHSRKPDHSYRLVEKVSFGPYVEVFARERRFGWDSLGDEIDGRDIREALAD